MLSRKRGFRAMVLGLLVTAGLALAPAAFARTYVDVGIGGPGYSIGYSHGGHGYYGHGYYGHGYYPRYGYSVGYYAPTYYAPAYYDYGPYAYGSCYVRGHHDRWGNWHPGHYVSC